MSVRPTDAVTRDALSVSVRSAVREATTITDVTTIAVRTTIKDKAHHESRIKTGRTPGRSSDQ